MACKFNIGDEVKHVSAPHLSGKIIDISGPFSPSNRYLINIELNEPYEETVYDEEYGEEVVDVEVHHEWQSYDQWFELVKPRTPKKSGFGKFSKHVKDVHGV